MIPADAVVLDLLITAWREQMAQRERAEAAEARVAELEERLAESARSEHVLGERNEELARKLAETGAA